MVWVEEYTRDDGTKVSGHWRSKPDGDCSSDQMRSILPQDNGSAWEMNMAGDAADGNSSENPIQSILGTIMEMLKLNSQDSASNGEGGALTGGAADAGELSNLKMSDYITQENEKAVLRNDPESIAGVERGTPMSFEEAAGEDINPAYYQDEYQDEYVNNCQSCVLAYEARRRGYDVQSVDCKAGSKAEELSYTTFGAWLDSDGKPCEGDVLNADNAETLNVQLDNIVKQGERYAMITYLVRDTEDGCNKDGHITVLDRDNNGRLRLYDPQSNRTRQADSLVGYIKANADYTGRQPSLILRIDDKKFNPYYLDEVVRGVSR